jgi:phosphatidylserine/phosphatidylglycerophosphate/cardiolipin synthase-like enzyme
MRAPLLTAALALLVATGARAQGQDELQLEPLGSGLEGAAFFSPYDNLDQKVLAALDQAKPGTTVYMSYYSLSYAEYPKMFKKLRDRGVTLRLNLFEGVALDPTYAIDDELKAAGYDVALVPNLRNPSGTASLHTKFTVVNDELIVTGSANLSASASLANHEHVVIVRNARLARVYKAEFEEQRAAQAAMQAALTPEEWQAFHDGQQFPSNWTGGRKAQLDAKLRAIDVASVNPLKTARTYFSPDDVCERVAVAEVQKAKRTVRVAMYSFVSVPLARALADASARGVAVTLVADDHQQSIPQAESVNSILEADPRIRFVRGNNHLGNYSSIHHKYAVIDDEVVLAGSFNWTSQANRYNDENLIVIKSKALAKRFVRDFATLLATYDPAGEVPGIAVPGTSARVLLAVAVRFPVPRGYEVVVYGDAPELGGGDPKKGVPLRTSRSVEPNWLGSVSLPRGAKTTFKLAIRKPGSLAGTIGGEEARAFPEGDQLHEVTVNAQGLAQLHQDEWKGANPLPPEVVTPNAAPVPATTPGSAPAPNPNAPTPSTEPASPPNPSAPVPNPDPAPPSPNAPPSH